MTSADELRLPQPDSQRWRVLRAGLQNVWEYDDQRLVFHRGRLLLRGKNESGKTKALELLLPFLLDASLQPARLDPFGSSARLMHWNLLSEANAEVNVNVGYVWLELGRRGADGPQVLTIGAGLKARRTSKAVEDWYFVTPQRVDVGLTLWDERRVPLMRPALAEALQAGGGEVFERAQDYRKALNDRLFQMPEEQYGTLIDALLQLRRPQLSKQLEPDELSRVLSASLPPPDSKVVGTLAEGFERLDRHRAERDDYHATLQALAGFLKIYRDYAASWAKAKVRELTRAESAFHAAKGQLRQAEQEHTDAVSRQATLAAKVAQLEGELQVLSERIQTLRASESFRAVEALHRAEADEAQAKVLARRAAARAADSRVEAEQFGKKLRKASDELEAARQSVEKLRETARDRATEAALGAPHDSLDRLLDSAGADAVRGTLRALISRREEVLSELSTLAQSVSQARAAEERAAGRLREAGEQLLVAQERLKQAEGADREAREAFTQALRTWGSALKTLKLELAPLLEVPPLDVRETVELAAEAARTALEEEGATLRTSLNSVEEELGRLRRERELLEGRSFQPPPAPAWRGERPDSRPGAPLYLLCEFAGDDGALQARVEGALEAAGLLDAWVTPEGKVLEAGTEDVVLTPARDRGEGQTLLGLLRPVPGGRVPPAVVEAVLSSVRLLEQPSAEVEEGDSCWVGTDGRFRLGPLRGARAKAAVEFIGAANRERERLRRLGELEARRAELAARQGELSAALGDVRSRRERLSDELKRLPDTRGVVEARVRLEQAEGMLQTAREARASAQGALAEREALLRGAVAKRDQFATGEGLRAWVESVEVLERRTAEYGREVGRLVQAFESAERARAARQERHDEHEAASDRARDQEADALELSGQASRASAHAQALRDSHGATREEVLGQLDSAEKRQVAAQAELKLCQGERQAADEAALRGQVALEQRQGQVTQNEEQRRVAETTVRAFVQRGLVAAAGVDRSAWAGKPEDWSYTELLQAARQIDEATSRADPSEEAREKALNKVSAAHQDLVRGLRAEVKVLPEQRDGLTEYQAAWNGRVLGLVELSDELVREVAARDALLSQGERELFESFLTGEAHQHLRARLRAAAELVARMNRLLGEHPTSSGMRLKLDWAVAPEAPAGAREAMALLFKSGELLTGDNRKALGEFLRERLDEARRNEESGMLVDRMLATLDYRRWHQFRVLFKTAQEDWRPLTRKAHATGSGGQKAVMLHLPLFAAAAAFYESAAKTSPRLILLDEAFAGIDKETRGQLMGLLAEFDLDFMMTSFEEWGFYEQLDGLSTYNLSRERGMRGVHAEWFLWDGHEATHVEGS